MDQESKEGSASKSLENCGEIDLATRTFWEIKYGRPLTEVEGLEIKTNVMALFAALEEKLKGKAE